jgi:hypothetical protein
MLFRIRSLPLASSCDDRLSSVSEPVYNREQLHLRRARKDRPPLHATARQNSTLLVTGSFRCSDDAGHPHAARRVRTFCFTKTMEKVPSDNAAPRFTKVRGILTLRYSSAQIGFSADNQHGAGAKVARRARFRPRCEGIAKNQLRRGFPVFSVCAMRSWVLRSPHRLTKASRSRSRTYCSGTSWGAVMAPPARMFASLRPTTPS